MNNRQLLKIINLIICIMIMILLYLIIYNIYTVYKFKSKTQPPPSDSIEASPISLKYNIKTEKSCL